jgi:hypothetical protein
MKSKLILSLFGAVALNGYWTQPASGGFAELPTAGLSTFSFLTAAAGGSGAVTGWHGGGTANRILLGLGSIGLGLVDPAPGTILDGQIVIRYPDNALAITGIGWFGPFAQDPSLPVPPVTTGPFSDSGNLTYNVAQPPNPALNVSVTNVGGVLTIQFDALPNGIASPPGEFNMLAIRFENISSQELVLSPAALPELATASNDVANMFMPLSQQIFDCVPSTSTDQQPVRCGANAPSIGFLVESVPEPGSVTLLGLGVLAMAAFGRWKK